MPPTAAIGRQQSAVARRELAGDELALELEADEQEEDGHQRVVDPELEREAGHGVMPEGGPRGRDRRIGEEQRDDRRGDQQQGGEALGEGHRGMLNAAPRECKLVPLTTAAEPRTPTLRPQRRTGLNSDKP